ncbi:MAG: serine/threonine-protein kinase [Myxococcota bacterium]
MTETSTRYQTLLPIASGGMGRVDLAFREDGSFQRLYAVKRLHAMFDEPSFREMFLEEARVAGLVRHANVVSVLDVGEDDDGPYLVMEFIDGVSLSALLKDVARTKGQLPLTLVCGLIAQVAAGVHAAHELTGLDGGSLQLVHRDVSPQNVLIGFDGVARVTDFGVAKALGRDSRTATGTLKGKLGYMSPEQLSFRDIDRRSDLFSIGVVLFECLALKRLYARDKGPARILYDPVPDIGDVRKGLPPRLVELSMQLLAKSPDARPATAAEVAERLEAIGEELSFDEDTVRIVDFLSERYESRRAAFQDEVRTAVDRYRKASEQATSKRRPLVSVLGAAAMVAVVGLLAVVGALVVPQEDSSVQPSPDVDSPPRSTEVGGSSDSPPGDVEPAVGPPVEESVQAAEASADPEGAPGSAEAPSEAPAASRSRPRRDRSRPRAAGMDRSSEPGSPPSTGIPIITDFGGGMMSRP